MDEGLIAAAIAFALGGILKGAIGAGTPVIAVPILSIYYGVPFAVAVFTFPALLSNIWQAWAYRSQLLPRSFVLSLVFSAGAGTAAGSVLLAALPSPALMLSVAVTTFAYVGFRIAKPDWSLNAALAARIALPVGFASGLLQGAAGISAPVSVTFLNAMRLPREAFIGTISVFFLSMTMVQIPALWGLGLLTPDRVGLSLLACIPMFGAMPVGAWLARHIRRDVFDRIVMGLLVIIALRLTLSALAG
ncbi:MAG: sulfite exporter TauE/SafE family protein [Rhodobacteraceae bacterium]|nr:sulfite exporter TauE/SafE family protein [Paracoccaceae bacterium]